MTYLWLNVITASRLVLCAPTWFWCWWKRPRGMVVWMSLALAYFVLTDHFDGEWAKEIRTDAATGRTYTLESDLGAWLDHTGDVLFYGVVVLSIIRGSREPEARKPGARRATKAATAAPTPPPEAPKP